MPRNTEIQDFKTTCHRTNLCTKGVMEQMESEFACQTIVATTSMRHGKSSASTSKMMVKL